MPSYFDHGTRDEGGKEYDRRRFIEYCRRNGTRYCMCISPRIGSGESNIMNGAGHRVAKICAICHYPILETIQ